MTPERLFDHIDREFNHLRDEAIAELNDGNATPNDRHTVARHITEEIVHQIFGTGRHFAAWCRVHGFRMTANEGFGHYIVRRDYRAQRVARPIALDPVFNWNPEVDEQGPVLAIAETVEWTLTERPHRLDRDIVYGAQGGYVVPPDIAQHILDSQEDNRPEYIEIVNGFDDVHSILNFSDFKSISQGV